MDIPPGADQMVVVLEQIDVAPVILHVGIGLTVTAVEQVLVHPAAFVTVTE